MEEAATALEEVLSSITDVIIETHSLGKFDPDTLMHIRRDLMSPPKTALMCVPESTVPDPATMIRALREYASMLEFLNSSQKESADVLAKYLFSAYVYRSTNQFHDAEVSTLIDAALGTDYDETAHRMWRYRNYKRIDKNFSNIADLFTALGAASAT